MSLPILPSNKPFFRIGEIAAWLDLETHVLRYWETEFLQFVRTDRSPKGQRVYSRKAATHLAIIKELLYTELYTIAGARRQLRLRIARGIVGEQVYEQETPNAEVTPDPIECDNPQKQVCESPALAIGNPRGSTLSGDGT